ncbi:MAG TPA: urate hydroxylase PuuD [Sphingomicrobium sp.]|nr:urate hydroxylase PuuD [Sphingomicrobium sp.]
MGKLLENLNLTLALGVVAAIALMMGLHADTVNVVVVLRWLHVVAGILWIGLLYYFNFVQIPTMPAIPAELKPAVSKHIAPNALFYFRWAAAATVLLGALLAFYNGYLVEALSLREGFRVIGIGMWLGLIMAFNVWFVIWPNQKKALGLVAADDGAKAAAARTAMLTSRVNTLLSIPMLYAMASFQTLPN